MTTELWNEAFERARQAAKLRQRLRNEPLTQVDRKLLEKQADELEQLAAVLKARAAAATGPRDPKSGKPVKRTKTGTGGQRP